MNPRELTEQRESAQLSSLASLAAESRGRPLSETECEIRTCYQRDVDRITHSKSFRRLVHKTQVFLNPEGDHYRTRMTHTLEVARVARTISRALGLNEDLTEAIALGHDLGHTPFGHAGERALDSIFGGFTHNGQSLRVVDCIEKGGAGLNLTFETRDGIANHPHSCTPATNEGRVVQLSDRMTYVNHDTDDAIRAGIFTSDDIPAEIRAAFGLTGSERLNTLVGDVIETGMKRGVIAISDGLFEHFDAFFRFLTERLYRNPRAKSEETKVFGILQGLFGYYADNPDLMPPEYRGIAEKDGVRRAICDYVSGMTDSYALRKYEQLFIPKNWSLIPGE